jgi:hypothetical protein
VSNEKSARNLLGNRVVLYNRHSFGQPTKLSLKFCRNWTETYIISAGNPANRENPEKTHNHHYACFSYGHDFNPDRSGPTGRRSSVGQRQKFPHKVPARLIPVPSTASPELQAVIARPLITALRLVPKTNEEWRLIVAMKSEQDIAVLAQLRKLFPVDIKTDIKGGVKTYKPDNIGIFARRPEAA